MVIMRKIWNQAAFNLRKDKSSFLSFGIIILITALILNCAAVLLMQVDPAYEAKFDKLLLLWLAQLHFSQFGNESNAHSTFHHSHESLHASQVVC